MEEDGSLVIKKLSMDDSGMFQCLAMNEAGEASVYTWLKAKSKYIYVYRLFATVILINGGILRFWDRVSIDMIIVAGSIWTEFLCVLYMIIIHIEV